MSDTKIETKILDEMIKISNAQAVIGNDIIRMKDDIKNLYGFIDNRFVVKEEFHTYKTDTGKELNEKVSKEAFEPVKRLAYGMVTFILLAVLGLIINTSLGKN